MTDDRVMRPKVVEADVDRELVSAIQGDKQFVVRLVREVSRQTGIPFAVERVEVETQAAHAGAPGTIDLLIHLNDARGVETGRILVENKLDSTFTPTQPERYASSTVAMNSRQSPAAALICAPAEYLRKSRYLDAFNARLGYEDLSEWLGGNNVIQQAIRKFQMPYEPDPVEEVREFHEGYRRMVERLEPQLVVKSNPNATGARPRDSQTIYFDTKKCLPRCEFLPALRFSHQCRDLGAVAPSVKIMFGGWAVHEQLLRRLADPHLAGTALYLRRAGKSLGLTHDTPPMDNMRSVSEQLDAVRTGIRAAAGLRAWMYANDARLREWASAVLEIDP